MHVSQLNFLMLIILKCFVVTEIQSVVMVATSMFLQTSVTISHTRCTSALWVSTQRCWISFETAAHCREPEHEFTAMLD